MASLPDGNVAKSPIKQGSSFNSPTMEGSPTSGFPPTTEIERHHLQHSQGPWHQSAAGQLESPFGFVEDHNDTRRLLPTFFSAATDGYGNTQFGSPILNSCTWDNKLSYVSSANGIAGNPLSLTGNSSNVAAQAQMHAPLAPVNAGLDYVHTGLEHMHAGHRHMNGDVSLRKILMSPQPSSELFKQGNWPSVSVGASLDPSNEGLPAHGVSMAPSHCLPNLSADPGFADRAARFSAFGSMGYSECQLTGDVGKDAIKGKLSQMKPVGQYAIAKCSAPNSPNGFNNGNINNAQENIMFPSLKEASSVLPLEETNRTLNMLIDGDDGAQKPFCTSVNESDESIGQEVSSSCEKNLGGGATPMQGPSENIGRKRKAGSQKLKDGVGGLAANSKEPDPDEGRSKCQLVFDNALERTPKPQLEQSNSGNSGDSTPKSVKESTKPPEAPKPDFIHVRARRGQATDSHSLAERVRREKISERMKFLQDLVPGCSKVTGKAVMLDEIINYVQSLQRQVEFLSMKLASVNPRVEFNIDNLFGRERLIQPRVPTPSSVFGLENSNLYSAISPHLQPHVPLQPLVGQCPALDSQPFGSDPALRRTMSTPPTTDGCMDTVSQVSQAWDDELQSVVQMSFAQRQATLDLQGQLLNGQLKIEH